MALKNGKVNELNVLGLRKVNFPARHFHYTFLPKSLPIFQKSIDNWIYNNLNGRYYIGTSFGLENNNFTYQTKIGFEQEKELSFFLLSCPFLH